ncbi:MAG: DUF1992 domain-containing protein [Anaerolineales bacterium]|nr:DUF1992 domain-containing protein [Anaerolineales bacterium]
MSFEKAVEAAIKEAQERGEFDNLKGKGKPIDLDAYFETPEELRVALSALKNAGIASQEVELLQEIAVLKEQLRLEDEVDESKQGEIKKLIHDKQLQVNILMDRQRKYRKG